jgi:hypothetical protein
LTTAVLATATEQAKPPLNWPKVFGPRVTDSKDWVEYKVDGGPLRFRMLLPPEWRESQSPDPDNQIFSAIELPKTIVVTLDVVEPTSFALDQPLPAESLASATAAMRDALSPRGYDVVAGGQIRAGGRVWLWQEARIQPGALGPWAKLLSIGSGSTWIFTATPHGHRVTLRYLVFSPSGATPTEIERRATFAGSILAAILDKIVIERK